MSSQDMAVPTGLTVFGRRTGRHEAHPATPVRRTLLEVAGHWALSLGLGLGPSRPPGCAGQGPRAVPKPRTTTRATDHD